MLQWREKSASKQEERVVHEEIEHEHKEMRELRGVSVSGNIHKCVSYVSCGGV